jgi:hypothetical protein
VRSWRSAVLRATGCALKVSYLAVPGTVSFVGFPDFLSFFSAGPAGIKQPSVLPGFCRGIDGLYRFARNKGTSIRTELCLMLRDTQLSLVTVPLSVLTGTILTPGRYSALL